MSFEATNKTLVWSITDRLAHVEFNRPGKMNSINKSVFEDLLEAAEKLGGDESVSAVVISGRGRAFSAGLDFDELQGMKEGGDHEVVQMRERLGSARALAQQAVHVWSMLDVPVIAGIHGFALGGGLQLSLGADIRFAEPATKFSMMEVKWGIIPDMTGTQALAGLVGRDHAKELVFTGRTITGEDAERIGLVTHCVPDAVAAALELGREMAVNSRNALKHAKRLLELSGRVSLADGFDAEQDAVAALLGTDEQRKTVADRLATMNRA